MFRIVADEAIKAGQCTDIYFPRCEEVLAAGDRNPQVTMEVSASSLPQDWGVFCGLEDAVTLFAGTPVDLDALPEGSIFHPHEPVLRISGKYRDFARLETALLGFLCHASGVASAAAHLMLAARGVPVFSFGSRRQHPALAAMIERSAWIGGVDGVSNTCAPEGIPLVGTMPHAFVMCYPRPADAWTAFSRHARPDVPRVMLCDTCCDEKAEALLAAELGCDAVRLDTPRSRRGDMRLIIEEVRWDLDARGHEEVRIFLSGGITAEDVVRYRDIVDAFGIGGAIANAPVIDFSMDIVEIEGSMVAKRGKRSGVKQVYDLGGGRRVVLPAARTPPEGAVPLIGRFVEQGTVVARPDHHSARKRVLEALESLRNDD